ncbi:MAG: sulfurtransferase [Alcaligenaceae bacterium]|nr:sulfurtransferase [Alcaligenaceae bacterium]
MEPLISALELQDLLSDDDALILLDARHDLGNHQLGREQYLEGHIPGAIFLDHEIDLCGPKTGKNGRHPLPDREDFIRLLGNLGIAPQANIVVYDARDSMFAAHLWWMLRWAGCTKVRVLNGGWSAWGQISGDIEREKPAPRSPVVWGAGGTSMAVVDVNAVLANIRQPVFTVIDARAENRFRGENETIDPVAGHIPGAINWPFSRNLDSDGFFRPVQELESDFAELLGKQTPEKIIHQCGSGISACHNLLAMEVAGLTGSALYPGSWSEWCSDSSRPVAVG